MRLEDIAEAFVTMRPDFANFGREAASGIRSALGGIAGFIGDTVKRAGIVVGAAATGALVSLGKVGIGYNTLEQTSRAAFETILGSADAANRMMDDIAEFGKTSPFPRQAFIEATRQMLGFGFAAEDVVPTLDVIQDAVAAMGGGAEEIAQITDVFSKIQSGGRVTTEDLNRLGDVGINAFEILADAAGKSIDQIRDDLSAGAIDSETALAALTEGMEERFDGAAENVKKTWTGALDRVKGAWRDLGSLIVEPFISREGGGLAVGWANTVADELREVEAAFEEGGWRGAFGVIAADVRKELEELVGGATEWLREQGPEIGAAVLGWRTAFIEWIGPMIPGMLDRLREAMPEIGGWIAEQVPVLVDSLEAWGEAFVEFIAPHIPAVIEELLAMLTAVGDWIIDEGVPFLGDKLNAWGEAFVQWIIDAGPQMAEEATKLLDGLVLWIEEQVPTLAENVGLWAGEFINWIEPMIPDLLEALGEMLAVLIEWIVVEAGPKLFVAMNSVGAMIVDGIWQGIKDRWPQLLQNLANALKELIPGANFLPDLNIAPELPATPAGDGSGNGGARPLILNTTINNPTPEPASESQTHALRRARYLAVPA